MLTIFSLNFEFYGPANQIENVQKSNIFFVSCLKKGVFSVLVDFSGQILFGSMVSYENCKTTKTRQLVVGLMHLVEHEVVQRSSKTTTTKFHSIYNFND